MFFFPFFGVREEKRTAVLVFSEISYNELALLRGCEPFNKFHCGTVIDPLKFLRIDRDNAYIIQQGLVLLNKHNKFDFLLEGKKRGPINDGIGLLLISIAQRRNVPLRSLSVYIIPGA